MRAQLERYFEFERHNATWRTEALAGATTFVTMAYIVFVNPSILASTGMNFAAVTAATCLSAAIGCFLMGALARYPIALAPGMGINAYFAFAVVKGLGVSWQTALGAVFLSGILFLILTAAGIRQMIVEAIPRELYASVAVGIGLFIAFVGLQNAGLVAGDPATLVRLGNVRAPATLLALGGLVLTGALLVWRVKGAMLIGVALTTIAGALTGVVKWAPQAYNVTALGATAFHLDVGAALKLGLVEIVFVFLFVDLFDNLGTLVAVGLRAKLFDNAGRIPRLNAILTSDAIATTAGSLLGTSTVVSYIESAAGVAAGGRTGVTAIVTGVLFVVALFVAPLAGVVPVAATAPVLILVGALMMAHARDVDWDDPLQFIPAFLTMVTIPLTFSIANGLAFGFLASTVLNVLAGRARKLHWLVYVLAALCAVRFFYLGRS